MLICSSSQDKPECISFCKGTVGFRNEPALELREYFGLFIADANMLELSEANSGSLITICLRASHFLVMKLMRSISDKTKEPL